MEVAMNIADLPSTFPLPKSVLKKLSRLGLFEEPLSEDDIAVLKVLGKILDNDKAFHVLIRQRLIRKSKKDREAYLNTLDLETKWERYAFTRFYNYDPQEHGGKKLRLQKVVEDLKKYLKFTPNYFQLQRLYTVRKKAYNIKLRKKKNKQLQNDADK
ncbi:MAG: hypothetical protein P4L51_24155 [Puia sp.]|nr:hypothetical protein [Puia sp.]